MKRPQHASNLKPSKKGEKSGRYIEVNKEHSEQRFHRDNIKKYRKRIKQESHNGLFSGRSNLSKDINQFSNNASANKKQLKVISFQDNSNPDARVNNQNSFSNSLGHQNTFSNSNNDHDVSRSSSNEKKIALVPRGARDKPSEYNYENSFFNYYDYIFPRRGNNYNDQMALYNITQHSLHLPYNDSYYFYHTNFSDFFYYDNYSSYECNSTCIPFYYLTNSTQPYSFSNTHETLNFLALSLLIFPILTVFGNILVVSSVITDRALQTVTNYFIVSLAISDVMVAIFVMPLAVYVEVGVCVVCIKCSLVLTPALELYFISFLKFFSGRIYLNIVYIFIY